MAKLFRIYFRSVEKEYNPERKYVKKKGKIGSDYKHFVSDDGSITVLEDEIKKYWEYGDGVSKLEFAGELDDNYLKPVISETEFVDEQIRSKKNGEIIGYQG